MRLDMRRGTVARHVARHMLGGQACGQVRGSACGRAWAGVTKHMEMQAARRVQIWPVRACMGVCRRPRAHVCACMLDIVCMLDRACVRARANAQNLLVRTSLALACSLPSTMSTAVDCEVPPCKHMGFTLPKGVRQIAFAHAHTRCAAWPAARTSAA